MKTTPSFATSTNTFAGILEKDARYKAVVLVMAKHRKRHDALIEVLHVVQDVFGYLPMQAMEFISHEMKIPPSRIYGVATFYHFFSLKPKGEHTCVVCTGTACHVKGSGALLQQLEGALGLRAGEVTPDKKLGLQTVRCLGCCGLAPVAVVDGQILAKAGGKEVLEKIKAVAV